MSDYHDDMSQRQAEGEAAERRADPREALRARIRKLIATPKELLRGLEKQEAYIGAQMLRTPPCPWCHEPVSQIDAAPDDFAIDGCHEDTIYVCPHCEGKLLYVLPFLGGGWHWWTR